MLQTKEIVSGIYRVECEIGRGGTGVVYKAVHLRLQKYVVLKRIATNFGDIQALRKEADILKNLHHPFLPQVYDFICREGEVYTVMDYIEGHDFEALPCGPGRLQEKDLLRWFRQLAEVLAYLHSRRRPILHSDIKPGNLILTPEGNICLIDFNISLDNSQAGKIVGFSEYFAAPEQRAMAQMIQSGQPSRFALDERMDLYSAGATFYYLLTGRRPSACVPNPPLGTFRGLPYSPGFTAVIDRCMAWDRGKRYPSAKKLLAALDDLKKQDKRYRKYLLLQAASWLGCAALAAGGVFCLVRGVQAQRAEDFQRDHAQFSATVETGGTEEILEQGLAMLNEPRYRGILEQEPAKRAEILYVIGSACYDQEDYEGAQSYYAEALRVAPATDANYGRYYTDYALALAECGRLVEAGNALEQAGEAGVQSAYLLLIQASIAQKQGEQEACLAAVEAALAANMQADLCVRACLLAAQASQNDASEMLRWLERAREYEAQPGVLRWLGTAYAEQAKTQIGKSAQLAYAEKALDCYKALCARSSATLDDKLSYAVVCRMLGQNEDGIRMLQDCARQAPQDYRVAMNLAFAYMDMGNTAEAAANCSKALRQIAELPEAKRQAVEEEALEELYQIQRKLGI